MSNEAAVEEAQRELDEMEQQLTQAAEAEKEKAEQPEKIETLQALPPDPIPSHAPEPTTQPEATVTQQPSDAEKPKDDPMEWARKKGFKSPEDMARALLQKEQEFHQSRQKQNGQQQQPPAPPMPTWQPAPDMGYGNAYPPPPMPFYQPPVDVRRLASSYEMLPEDFDKVARVAADLTRAAIEQERTRWNSEMSSIRRTTERNNEVMTLMQDPAFRDERVQREIHAVIDSDPTIFQRPGAYSSAFEKALGNLARKQLQQGVTQETGHQNGNTPPVTAGGGNGSANVGPRKVTEREFNSWPVKDQEAFLLSNGRTVPKK